MGLLESCYQHSASPLKARKETEKGLQTSRWENFVLTKYLSPLLLSLWDLGKEGYSCRSCGIFIEIGVGLWNLIDFLLPFCSKNIDCIKLLRREEKEFSIFPRVTENQLWWEISAWKPFYHFTPFFWSSRIFHSLSTTIDSLSETTGQQEQILDT